MVFIPIFVLIVHISIFDLFTVIYVVITQPLRLTFQHPSCTSPHPRGYILPQVVHSFLVLPMLVW